MDSNKTNISFQSNDLPRNKNTITKTLGLWFVEVVKKNLCVQYFKEFRQNKIKSIVNSNI